MVEDFWYLRFNIMSQSTYNPSLLLEVTDMEESFPVEVTLLQCNCGFSGITSLCYISRGSREVKTRKEKDPS